MALSSDSPTAANSKGVNTVVGTLWGERGHGREGKAEGEV